MNTLFETGNLMLTQRERQVLLCVSEGNSSEEVSRQLGISQNTVLSHMKSIHRKLNVNNRQHAVAKALAQHLI